tara:strand:- start:1428 stop:1622 length:195 start_codon:yes stop_codon:yes gene_type:complete
MKKEEIDALVTLRQDLISKFSRLKDYKNNKNAIMREIDHAKIIHEIITRLDSVLTAHVNFSDKK